LDYHHG